MSGGVVWCGWWQVARLRSVTKQQEEQLAYERRLARQQRRRVVGGMTRRKRATEGEEGRAIAGA